MSTISRTALQVFVLAALLTAPARLPAPEAEDKGWPGLHKDGKPFPSKNLEGTKAKVDFLYHGPEEGKPHLEGRVLKESREAMTIGVSFVAASIARKDVSPIATTTSTPPAAISRARSGKRPTSPAA